MKKSTRQINRIGLIANTEKVFCKSALREAVELIRPAGKEILCEAETAKFAELDLQRYPDNSTLAEHCDLLLVIGGDGTMLRVARDVAGHPTPILGINAGRLGFLTALAFDQLPDVLSEIWRGEFSIGPRSMIEATGTLEGETYHQHAFNDFVISRAGTTRMIELEVSVDEEILTRYRCDGLIVSTPTGSTAYSLAAGGPIIDPTAEVTAITPICPHTLTNRALVVSLDSTIEIKALTPKMELIISADGQVQNTMRENEAIRVKRSSHRVQLLHPRSFSFFNTLRQKLHWSGSNF